jgi:formyltetrahydrofolate deformylase
MDWKISDSAVKRRVVIMVSKQEHCLYDLLSRWQSRELDIEIPCVISNHDTFKAFVEWHGIPFHYVPGQPRQQAGGLRRDQPHLRRSQGRHDGPRALHADPAARAVRPLPGQMINIHHSFLPSFVGARPYHQAYQRGVKLIGATCHYVTRDLDQGPIIEQDVIRIDHSDSVEDMVRYGKDIEKAVLARGLRYHLETVSGTRQQDRDFPVRFSMQLLSAGRPLAARLLPDDRPERFHRHDHPQGRQPAPRRQDPARQQRFGDHQPRRTSRPGRSQRRRQDDAVRPARRQPARRRRRILAPAQWRLAQVVQEMPSSSQSATDFVIEGDSALLAAQAEVQGWPSRRRRRALAHAYMALHDAGAHDAQARAQALILGLGFKTTELNNPVDSFSGGWRMRLQLARALMCPSDLLLLDEPTNHLDLDALVWLESWLKRYEGTMVVISHDREFLDAVTTVTLHLENGKLTRYGGNYSTFEETRAQQIDLQQNAYLKQQDKIAHLQSFITRFKAKATKAKQAQSRVKALERMERLAPVLTSADFTFEFKEPANLPNPMLVMADACFGYPPASDAPPGRRRR